MSDSGSVQLVRRLVAEVPALRRLYAIHTADNDELLPHVFMGDVTRFVMASEGFSSEEDPIERSREESRRNVDEILKILEKGMLTRDEGVQNLIVVSFLENLDFEAEGFPDFASRMGPNLAEQLAVLEKWFSKKENEG